MIDRILGVAMQLGAIGVTWGLTALLWRLFWGCS
jgi:hypothetical protein